MRNTYLDYFRFIAFILMFTYHFVISDYIFFSSGAYNFYRSFFEIIGVIARYLFILTSGFSLYYSQNKYTFTKLKSRFLTLLTCSILISFFSYLFFPQYFIFNGIIHFFTFASVLNFVFLKLSRNFKFLLFIINLSFSFLLFPKIDSPYLFFQILGAGGIEFSTLDFFPLLPWYNLIILGYFTAPLINKLNELKPLKQNLFTKIGSHSLKAYMLHPFILLLFFFFVRV